MKIRHHGDFHLGQMLIVKDDVFIIDFEGEPRRSLAERRRKAPVARDLAGLIRSIDYSATAALDRALRSAPDEHGKIAKALDDWRERAVDSVLGRRIAPKPTACSIFSSSKRCSTKSNTRCPIAPIGCESR
jgi:maltose alpha-D-glucosyltransferase/alpha-amylase